MYSGPLLDGHSAWVAAEVTFKVCFKRARRVRPYFPRIIASFQYLTRSPNRTCIQHGWDQPDRPCNISHGSRG